MLSTSDERADVGNTLKDRARASHVVGVGKGKDIRVLMTFERHFLTKSLQRPSNAKETR